MRLELIGFLVVLFAFHAFGDFYSSTDHLYMLDHALQELTKQLRLYVKINEPKNKKLQK